jgi:hypothetical protein
LKESLNLPAQLRKHRLPGMGFIESIFALEVGFLTRVDFYLPSLFACDGSEGFPAVSGPGEQTNPIRKKMIKQKR